MSGTLNFATLMTLAFALAIIILFIAGSVRAIRVAARRARREAQGESAMLSIALQEAMTRLKQQGFAARAAVADTPGCAWAVARYSFSSPPTERGRRVRIDDFIVPRGGNEAAMLPLPIAALRADADIVADLKTSGLVSVGDLASRPRAPFVARFGAELILRLDQALARADEPIAPRLPVPAAMAEPAPQTDLPFEPGDSESVH